MAAKKLTITEGLDLAADDSITRADFVYWFTQALFGDVDRDHFASGTSPVVSSASAPSSPATGLGWHNSSTGLVSFWSGSEWLSAVTFSATAPASTGILWYDTTLEITRRYSTIDSIAGWHPVDSAYQLMHNRSGGTIAANSVVAKSNAGTSNREFTSTIVVKDRSVVGVLLEETDDNASGVIATVQGGAVIDVLADDGAADGAVARGDALVSYSVAGECRTAGALPSAGVEVSAGHARSISGVPYGAFAEALSTKDATTHLVRARMLGAIGAGAYQLMGGDKQVLNTSPTTSTTWADVDITSSLADSKQSPAIQADLLVQLNPEHAGGAALSSNLVSISPDRSTSTDWECYASSYHGGSSSDNIYQFRIRIPTVDVTTAVTAPGNLFAWQPTAVGAPTALHVIIELMGYIY